MSGSAQQIQYLVTQHVIPPLWYNKIFIFPFIYFYFSSNLLQQHDAQMLQVCLDAIHNILKQTSEANLEALVTEIEECGGNK